ncbi:MAG: cation:proton antiporter [Candidatus Pacebacteria bacterium]|nr:cation:proton antiporter [Candidatus Paceibacterota bacterium]MBP9832071.1 cation:proton antiporter [Candidatus Paceibacterota bacterium]
MNSVFLELAIMLSVACVIGYTAMRFRLPLVMAYLLAGVALSAYNLSDSVVLHTLPEIGIAFVLFLIGMELNLSEIRSLGRPIIVATLFQIVVSSVAGFTLATFFGFSGTEAAILGISLAFASTIVIAKMLSERRDTASLYGKLSIGILLVEDLVAIIVMVAITRNLISFGWSTAILMPLLIFTVKAIALISAAFLISRFVLPFLFNKMAKSVELLFLAAITWCFIFTSVAVLAGFSVVIGAFLAGVALASSPYQIQIQAKVKPIRDFFVALFFIYIGSQVDLAGITNSLPIIFGFTALALFMKPFAYLVGLSFFKFRKHTLFQTSLNMTQVSEFSLIVVLLAVEHGFASESALAIIAGSAVLSIIFSSTLMNHSESIYTFMKPFVARFQRKEAVDVLPDAILPPLSGHVVVVGADRVGTVVIEYLKKAKIEVLVLDYNPTAVRRLRAQGYHALYGDVSDSEILANLQLNTAHLIISTAGGTRDNLALLDACRISNVKAQIVVRTDEADQEQVLRDAGADYVIFPERVSGDFLVSKLEDEWPNLHFS